MRGKFKTIVLLTLCFGVGPVAHSTEQSDVAALRLQSSQYVNQNQKFFREDASANSSSFAIGLAGDRRWKILTGKISAEDEFNANENWNYVKVYDLYGGIGKHFSLGRKREAWTNWERIWSTGLFQPRYLQDKLNPEEAGLTGLFWNQSFLKSGSMTLALLPIHVPDFGAHFYVKDDHFASENPWFSPPASQFIYREQKGEIHYSLNEPSISDVINHPGAAFKLEWKEKSYFSRFSYAYKPMPQFLLGFPSDRKVLVAAGKPATMTVDIHPSMVYHRVTNLEGGIRSGRWLLSGGVAHENPETTNPAPASWTTASVRPAWIWTSLAQRYLEEEGSHASWIRFGFFKVSGGDADDQGRFATSGDSLFEARYFFREAIEAALGKEWRGWGLYPVETELRLIYDRVQDGGVASLKVGRDFNHHFRVDFIAEFLGLLGEEAQVKDGFLSTYRANDRVGLGMTYVF